MLDPDKNIQLGAAYLSQVHAQFNGNRVLATRLGMAAVDAIYEERWGSMVSLTGTDINIVSIADATGGLKTVPPARYDEAAVLFG